MFFKSLKPSIASAMLAAMAPAASGADIALLFDDVGETAEARNSGAIGEGVPMRQRAQAEISDENPKFGAGGLKSQLHELILQQSLADDPWYETFSTASDELTVAVWLHLPEITEAQGTSANIRIVSREGAPNAHGTWFFSLIEGRRPYFSIIEVDDAGNEIGSTTSPGGDFSVPKGQWTHVAMTFDRGMITLFVDGEVVHTGPVDVSRIPEQGFDNVRSLRLNILSPPEGAFVDDFAIFAKKALSQDDIRLLADEGLEAFLNRR